MIVFKSWRKIKKNIVGDIAEVKTYKIALLLGIIPLYISIDG